MIKICIGITRIWASILALLVTSCATRDTLAFLDAPLSHLESGINNYLTDCWWRLSEIMHIIHIKFLPNGDT